MLKIKDNVDLKELKKFGFEIDRYNLWYEYHAKKEYASDTIVINAKNKEISFYQNYNGKSYDVLYDLIQAGLVE